MRSKVELGAFSSGSSGFSVPALIGSVSFVPHWPLAGKGGGVLGKRESKTGGGGVAGFKMAPASFEDVEEQNDLGEEGEKVGPGLARFGESESRASIRGADELISPLAARLSPP